MVYYICTSASYTLVSQRGTQDTLLCAKKFATLFFGRLSTAEFLYVPSFMLRFAGNWYLRFISIQKAFQESKFVGCFRHHLAELGSLDN